MKKILTTLLMLTCTIGLTACGADESISEFQQNKIDQAEQLANYAVDYAEYLVENDIADTWLENYNNVEMSDLFTQGIYKSTNQQVYIPCEGKGINGALTSFGSGLDKLGGIIEKGEPTSVVDDDQIIVTVPITGQNMNGSVEVIFSNDIYFTMSSCTLNLDETKGQLMARAGLNTLLGMGTVFLVLILISLIISSFGLIGKMQDKKKKETVTKAEPTPAPQPDVVEEEELADDTELVAVIAAAIAAYEGTSADGFQVRSIKRANTRKWQRG